MMRVRAACLLVAAVMALTSAAAATQPAHGHATKHAGSAGARSVARPAASADPAGRWTLDIEHSELGPGATTKPRSRIDTWTRDGRALRVHEVIVKANGDSTTLDWSCRTDSVEVVNTMMGTPVRTLGNLVGRVLHLVFTATGAFGTIVTDEHWTMAPDRSTFVLERETRGPMGNYHQRYVFRPL